MRRLRPFDRLLVVVLVSIWAAAFALHLRQVWLGRLAWVGVYVTAPASAQEYPVVRGFWPGTGAEASGLRVGDRLLRVDETDIRGVGPVGFVARAEASADAALSVTIGYERDGVPRDTVLRLAPALVPWRIAALVVALVATGIGVLVRVPDAPIGRAVFLAALTFALHWTLFPGGPPAQTWAWAMVFVVTSLLAFPLLLRAILIFPERPRPPTPLPWWPWAFAVFGPVAFSWVFGTPMPPPIGQLAAVVVNVAVMVAVLWQTAVKWRRATAISRRQIKWVVLGFYVGLVPIVATDLLTAVAPGLWWLHEPATMAEVVIPLSILIAIVRFNLFDIDRLIAATAVYSLVSFLLVTALLVVVPPVADLASHTLGLGASSARVVPSILLAGLVLPARRSLRPYMDRVFHAERYRLREGVDGLLRALATCDTRDELLATATERLQELARAGVCRAYVRADDSYVLAADTGGDRRPPSQRAAVEGATAAVIEARGEPLDLQGRRASLGAPRLTTVERAAIAPLGAVIVLPIRRGSRLAAFITLGEKRSGDVYTSSDLALLGAVALQLSSELVRLDLARFAPREIMTEIVRRPEAGAPQVREVTILLSDVQGSTAIAERLGAADLQEWQGEYFRTMADVVAAHEGIVVKTIGDALMALWNVPGATVDHPARGCRAALAMLTALEGLNGRWAARGWPPVAVRIGLHAGEAAVGSFGTGERVEYDARGDAVNLTARLEGLGKVYGVRVLGSAAVRAAAGEGFSWRRLGRVEVAAGRETVEVYELLGCTNAGSA